MRRRRQWGACAGLVAMGLLLNGCLFNVFQTAQMVRRDDVAFVVGAGLLDVGFEEEGALWAATPQARMAFGISDDLNLGLQTGMMIPLTTGSLGWLGAIADLKLSWVKEPERFALAAGFGGGYSLETLGWGVFGELFLDSDLPGLPLFLVYQPTVPLATNGFELWHHVAVGLKLWLSERARLLVQVDLRLPLISVGFAVDIGHRPLAVHRGL